VSTTVSPTATNIIEYVFKTGELQDVLKTHNDERGLTNLTSLVWDISLQDSSQLWSNELANQDCALEHRLFSSAQNLYGGYGWIEPNVVSAVNAWISEKSLLDKVGVTFEEIGHYLIIVSNRYSRVGCASSINVNKKCFVITCHYD